MFRSTRAHRQTDFAICLTPLQQRLLIAWLAAACLFVGGHAAAAEPVWAHQLSGDGSFQDIAHAVLARSDAVFITGALYRTNDGLAVPRGLLQRLDRDTGAAVWSVDILPAPVGSLGLQCNRLVDVPGTTDIAVGCGSGVSGYGVFVFAEDGTPRWSSLLGVSGGQNTFGGLAVDAQGRLFLAGNHRDGAQSRVQVHAYTASGQALWSGEYPGPETMAVSAAVVADGQGGAVIVGTIETEARFIDGLAARFNASGAVAWERIVGGPGAGAIDTLDAVIMSDDGIYVAGKLDHNTATASDGFVARLDFDGTIVWQSRLEISTGSAEALNALTTDIDSAVYAVGTTTLNGDSSDMMIASLNRDSGTLNWSRHSSSVFGTPDRYWDVALDAGGQAHAAGEATFVFGTTAAVYDSYDVNGNRVRRETYLGPAGVAEARALVVDAAGVAFIAGTSAGATSGFDMMALRYDSGDSIHADGFEGL